MTTINKLTAVDSLSSSDQLPVYDSSSGDARKSSLSLLSDWLISNFSSTYQKSFTTERASPSATGQTINIAAINDSVHLILTPAAGYANMTINLPSS